MPRLPPWLLKQARNHSSNLAALIPACRDLQSAKNELRWLTDFVRERVRQENRRKRCLAALCKQRGRGAPLQYVLGSQPFGPLDIKCKPGVLIPRPETEAYTYHLVDLLKSGQLLRRTPGQLADGLRIVDFCTGTGCIPILMYTLLQKFAQNLHVIGVDVAPEAVELAQANIGHNLRLGHMVSSISAQTLKIRQGDLFNDTTLAPLMKMPCDILVSNPPYISQNVWDYGHGQLGYSVRKFEPRLALVPSSDISTPSGWQNQDVFYSRLLDVASRLKPRVALFELGDEAQARRILEGLTRHKVAEVSTVEVWRDWPDVSASEGGTTQLTVERASGEPWNIPVKGNGNIRSVLIQFDWEK